MQNSDRTYSTRPDVRFRVVGDEAVVLRQDAGKVLVLNEIGGTILALIKEGKGIEAMADILSSQYEAEPSVIRSDIEEFLQTLEASGVIEES